MRWTRRHFRSISHYSVGATSSIIVLCIVPSIKLAGSRSCSFTLGALSSPLIHVSCSLVPPLPPRPTPLPHTYSGHHPLPPPSLPTLSFSCSSLYLSLEVNIGRRSPLLRTGQEVSFSVAPALFVLCRHLFSFQAILMHRVLACCPRSHPTNTTTRQTLLSSDEPIKENELFHSEKPGEGSVFKTIIAPVIFISLC